MSNPKPEILFKKFEIVSCFKKDEHSAVYLANHIYLEKKVFVKVLNTSTIPDQAITARFKKEAKILAKLEHPNIIKVFDFGTYKEFFYISFEHFKSKNLRELLNTESPDEEIKKDLFIQLVKALNFVHKHGVIHRDIKPENILVNENYMLKLTDFGLAQESMDKFVTQQYAIVGTPAYMSPEQIQGEKLTAKSDLFSLGIVAAELFTGTNPFWGEETNETINKIISFDEEKFNAIFNNLHDPYQKILRGLLAIDTEKRFDSAEEILKILNVTESEVSNAKPKENNKKFAFIILFIIIAVSIGLYFLININQNTTKTAIADKINTDSIGNKEDLNMSNKEKKILPLDNEIVNKENQKNKPVPIDKIKNTKEISFGELYIKCYPWAKIFINNQFIETTPLQKNINLKEGSHLLTLVHPDYPKYSDSIKILPDKLNFVEINLDTLFGYLDCQVYPWGELFVNGKSRGITPFEEPIRLSEGKYLLELKNPKYGSIKNEINIKKKDTLKLRFNMLQNSKN